MSKDPNVDLEHVYLFNIPRKIRELKKILSKYRGTRREIGLDDVLDCIFYLVAANEGVIDVGELYDYFDTFNGYDSNDPDENLAIDAADVHSIAQIAEDVMDDEAEFLAYEVEEVENREGMHLYFATGAQIGNTGYVEVRVQYQHERTPEQG